MNTRDFGNTCPSRRMLLHGAAGALGAAATLGLGTRRSAAQIKISQAAAGYQDHPNASQSCATCGHFLQPDKCQLLSGSISPQGWCRLFSPMSGRASATDPRGSLRAQS